MATRSRVQTRARSACTTFRALRSEWEDIRADAQDAMTTMANASIELESVGELALPETIDTGAAKDGVREAMRVKRLEALERARARVVECREDVADVRADFAKLADVDRYFASSIAEYPDDGALFKTLDFVAFRRAFGAAAKIFVDDVLAKETLMDNFIRGFQQRDAFLDRESALAVVSAYALDALVDRDALSEFDELVLTRELTDA